MNNKIILPLTIIIGAFIILSGCTSAETSVKNTADNTTDTSDIDNNIAREEPEKTQEEKTEEQLANLIADGSYEELTTYSIPGGEEELKILLEVEDNKITKLDFELLGEPKEISINKYQDSEEGLRELLIGKDLNEIEIPNSVSGSSLTTQAFRAKLNEMIEKY